MKNYGFEEKKKKVVHIRVRKKKKEDPKTISCCFIVNITVRRTFCFPYQRRKRSRRNFPALLTFWFRQSGWQAGSSYILYHFCLSFAQLNVSSMIMWKIYFCVKIEEKLRLGRQWEMNEWVKERGKVEVVCVDDLRNDFHVYACVCGKMLPKKIDGNGRIFHARRSFSWIFFFFSFVKK